MLKRSLQDSDGQDDQKGLTVETRIWEQSPSSVHQSIEFLTVQQKLDFQMLSVSELKAGSQQIVYVLWVLSLFGEECKKDLQQKYLDLDSCLDDRAREGDKKFRDNCTFMYLEEK